MTCPHSCPFRQAGSFHSLVWGDPVLSFIYPFSPQLGLRGGWGGEGAYPSTALSGDLLLPRHSSSAGDAEMNKNTDFPAICGAQVLVEER